jgi:O-antigen ligase
MTHRSRRLAAAAATGMALAGGVLALSASRLGVALAVAVGGAGIAVAPVLMGARRLTVALALGLGLAAGVTLELALGDEVDWIVAPAAWRLETLVAVVLLAGPVWLALRALVDRTAPRRRRVAPLRAAALVLAAAAVAGTLAFGPAAGRGVGPASDFLHGRSTTWTAALETFADRPLAGAGADAFLAGSARHQDGQTVVFAHDLPLELAAELGVAGLVLILALYAAAGRALWRARRTRALWLLGPATAAFLVVGLVDWPWHLAGAGAFWATAAGAVSAGGFAPRRDE